VKTYQPIYKDGRLFECIKRGEFSLLPSMIYDSCYEYERVCFDRILLIINDLINLGIYEGKVLDLGCNIGLFSHSMASRGYQVVGVDNNAAPDVQGYYPEPCLSMANKLSDVYNVYPHFVEADIMDYVMNVEEHFNVIFLLNIVHHFFNGYAKSGQGKRDLEHIFIFLKELLKKTEILYFEGPENEGIPYYSEGIEFPEWFKNVGGNISVTSIGMTCGANGRLRNVYRIQTN